jgi:hypothetical protein
MDKISEILDDIKLRLTSPFLLSFFISWCLWNWKITLGLLWYDSTALEQHGWSSVWEFVKTSGSGFKLFWGPFISAVVYTTAFPWVNTAITWYNSWIIAKR